MQRRAKSGTHWSRLGKKRAHHRKAETLHRFVPVRQLYCITQESREARNEAGLILSRIEQNHPACERFIRILRNYQLCVNIRYPSALTDWISDLGTGYSALRKEDVEATIDGKQVAESAE